MNKLAVLTSAAAPAACAGMATAGPSYIFEIVVAEGDQYAPVGAVTTINNLAINNSGDWRAEVDTDNADTEADGAVIGPGGVVHLREGDNAGADPATATIDSFDSISLNNNGDVSYNHFLDGTPNLSTDSGLYFNNSIVLQEGFVSGSPDFGNPTPYIGFFETKLNDSNQMLVVASIDDPNIASTVDRALVRLDLDGVGGFTENVLYKEGDVLAGQTEFVADFSTNPHQFDFTNAGNVGFIADLTGATTSDGVVYINSTKIAQEGENSGIDGRNWATFSALSINDNNDWAMVATLAGDAATNTVVVSNNGVVKQEGDSITTSTGTWLFTGFGSGGVEIDDAGNILWFGDWNDTATSMDTGLFLNDQLIVQEGVTTVNGLLLTGLSGVQDAYRMSENGRYIIFEGVLDGSINAVIRITVPTPGAAGLLALAGVAACSRRRR